MTIIEIFATIFGLTSVYLTVKQKIWCWPTGLVMVILYIVIFANARLYSDMGLQVIYVFLQIYGWYHWKFGGKKKDDLPVTRLRASRIFIWLSVGVVGTVGLGYVMSTYTNASFPFGDAFTTVVSLIAQWFLAKKILESWIAWIIVDVVAIGIYLLKGLYLTGGLYMVFLVLATMGLIKWYKSIKTRKLEEVAHQAA